VVGDSLLINSYRRFTELLSTNLLIQRAVDLNLKEHGIIWRETPGPQAVMKVRGLNLEKTWVRFGGGTCALASLLYSPWFMSPAAAPKLYRGFSDVVSL